MATNRWTPKGFDLDDDDEDEDDAQGQNDDRKNLPKGLRTYLAKLEKANKELDEKLKQRDEADRSTAIEKLLAEKKLPTKLAKLVPASVGADKVNDWLTEYADIFAPQAQGAPGDEDEDDMLEEDVAALQRLAKASNASAPATRAQDLMADLKDPNLTPEKLLGMIQAAGGGYGSG